MILGFYDLLFIVYVFGFRISCFRVLEFRS